ncbi:MAG: HupE/UreJ family protein [Roseivivax sp.]|nr:HupE/UreJ family protein [Roseivivax sp.]
MVRAWVLGLLLAIGGGAQAHEVRPAIGDLTVADGQLTLSLAINAEALVAGIDLDGVQDTNETEGSADVDTLRRLEPEALAPRLSAIVPQISAGIGLTADGTPVTLSEGTITVDPVGDPELPRDTLLVLQAAVPPGTQTVEMSWPREYGTLVLRQQGVDEPFTGYLSGGQSSGPIALKGTAPQSGLMSFLQYIPVGFEHILPMGLDHILFVLGLFFLSTHLGPLLWQVTAFTLAHTVTLALAVLGYVSVPATVVEPLIAASIVFVAVENVLSGELHKWRPVVVFCFGLLHGLGFASVLGEFGLPSLQVVPALLGFNVGVEIGQLTVIALAFLLTLPVLQRAGEGGYRRYLAVPASVVIALVGAYWFVQRAFA